MDKTKNILIIDDSEFDQLLMLKMLSRNPKYQATCCLNEHNPIEQIQEKNIDLILLDIMMPHNSGTAILKTIRKKYNQIELPVIMISGLDNNNDISGSLHLGANDYITKPYNFEIALSRVKTQLVISDLSKRMYRLGEVAAINALSTTYNHEVNNPLAIALASIDILKKSYPKDVNLNLIEKSFWRIADIMKEIKSTAEGKELQYEKYIETTKMLKLR